MKAIVFLSLVLAASALAPLFQQERKHVREDGVLEYIVVLNRQAPEMRKTGHVEEWLQNQGISVKVEQTYFLGSEKDESHFAGFAAFLSLDQLAQVRSLATVRYVEESSIMEVTPIVHEIFNGTANADPDWGQNRVDQRCLPLNNQFDPCQNTVLDCKGANTVAWVVDTGVRTTHVEFGGRAAGKFDNAAGDASTGNGDCNGHGTHCAGSIAGATYGIAPAATVYSVRVLNCQGSGFTANVISGFQYVADNQVAGKKKYPECLFGWLVLSSH
jgi:hypothetical protein